MGWLGSLLGGAVKPITDLYGNRQKRLANESEARANLDRIMAEAAAADSTVAGQIALVNAQNQNNTWKDEYALITITAPYWVAFTIGLSSALGFNDIDAGLVIANMFEPMAVIPEYWQETFKIGILSALGVTVLKKAIR